MATRVPDPYEEIGRGAGAQINTVRPPGGTVQLNDDGSLDVEVPDQQDNLEGEHFDNLAETMDPVRLAQIATDLLDAIDLDKEARKKRDQQYEEGLRRTGLGDDAPGGAPFNGASRAVHPVLLEAAIDFSARAMSELLPPEGPCKEAIVGDATNDKEERAKRVVRYMNYQITEQMESAYHEFEMGFTQCPLGGAFYTKLYEDNGVPAVMFIPIDKVHRPWSDGDFYSQPRITHEQTVDKYEFKSNVLRGLWMDVVDPDTGASNLPDETQSERANDRIIGRTQPSDDPDNTRSVFESSVMLALKGDEDDILPYLVTIDEQSRKILSIYRNWKEDDENHKRLDFLQEWAFWPWRGGYPIGMAHMIGGLAGAATGALRALLDAAFLNTVQTGVRLKGGATSGGQNVRVNPASTAEMQGTLAQDDIRKTYMPLEFPPPSNVLFELLGFLVDGARGVVRTTFDEYDKFGGQTPVGTAQMFVEQGLKNMGAVHGRLHRTMRRFLKQLWDLNARTVDNEEVIDRFGELMVTAEDFNGPMQVMPVSDPRIFSDMQRSMIAQLVAQRAQLYAPLPVPIYDLYKTELYFLKQHNVPNPEQFLIPKPEPSQQNPVAENVLASQGMPIKAFPGQDHEAHIATHIAFMDSQLFGSNTVIAMKFLPVMLGHLAEHVALWYADATLEAANAMLQETTGDPQLTVDSLAMSGTEAALDRLLAELQPEIMAHAEQELGMVPQAIAQAQMLIKRLQPPMPMDPSVVAQQDVQRQAEADQQSAQIKLLDVKGRQATAAQANADKTQLAREKMFMDNQSQQRAADQQAAELQQRDDQSQRQLELGLEQTDQRREQAEMTAATQHRGQDTQAEIAANRDQTQQQIASDRTDADLQIADGDNETALEIAQKNAQARKTTRMSDGASMKK